VEYGIVVEHKIEFSGENMEAECIMQPPRQKHEIEVKEKQTLKSLLTQEQVQEFHNGKIVAMSDGHKLRLDDQVKGTVLVLTPLQGG
jgi:sulfur carrier protein ThiS